MKKLMIAAAAAAMVGGAFADAIVYDIKISGKKSVTANGVVQMYGEYDTGKVDKQGNAILKTGWFKGDFDLDGKADKICYRKSGSFSWAGVIAGCDCNNDTAVGGMTGFKDPNTIIAAVWDTKAKKEVSADPTSVFFSFLRSGAKTDFVEGNLYFEVLDENDNTAGYLDLMGNGSFDAVKGYIKSVSGNFIGALPVEAITKNTDTDCTVCVPGQNGQVQCPAYDVDLCYNYNVDGDVDAANNGSANGVAFGTWSLKYNSGKSKKFAKLPTVVDEKDGKTYFMGSAIEKALGFPKYVKTSAKFEAAATQP